MKCDWNGRLEGNVCSWHTYSERLTASLFGELSWKIHLMFHLPFTTRVRGTRVSELLFMSVFQQKKLHWFDWVCDWVCIWVCTNKNNSRTRFFGFKKTTNPRATKTEGKKNRHFLASSVTSSGVDTRKLHETDKNPSTRVSVHSMQPCDKMTHCSQAWRVVNTNKWVKYPPKAEMSSFTRRRKAKQCPSQS